MTAHPAAATRGGTRRRLPLIPSLVLLLLNLAAVDGPANGQKSDQGPASWLPSNTGYRCEYVAGFVDVIAAYELSMPKPDHDMVRQVLAMC